MGALVHIGEVGIHHAGGSLILRPSLLAMSRLGTPEQVVNTLAVVFGEGLDCMPGARGLKGWKLANQRQLRAALEVWQACAPEEFDLDPITGCFSVRGGWRMGAADPADVIIIAQGLLRHGVLGDPDENREQQDIGDDENYEPGFQYRQHAATAMGHLGLSEQDAWNMTVTGLRLALEAKYPKPKSGKAGRPPTQAEYDETMAWFDKLPKDRGQGQ